MNERMFDKLRDSLQIQEDGFEELNKEKISASNWKAAQEAQEKIFNEVETGGKKYRQTQGKYEEWNEYLK